MPGPRILFVCTGNICRSPTAEGVLRAKARAAGLEIETDSAATGPWHIGDPPDNRAIRQAAARGYDISDLRARLFRAEDFEEFDLIIGMDAGHMRHLEGMRPGEACRAKLELFLDCLEGSRGREVPDPYYGDLTDYDHALDLIEQGCQRLLENLAAPGNKQATR